MTVFASDQLPMEDKAITLSVLASDSSYVKRTGTKSHAFTPSEEFTIQDVVWIRLPVDTAGQQSELQVCLPPGSCLSRSTDGWYLDPSQAKRLKAYTAHSETSKGLWECGVKSIDSDKARVTYIGEDTVDAAYNKGKLVKFKQSNETFILLPADVASTITSAVRQQS